MSLVFGRDNLYVLLIVLNLFFVGLFSYLFHFFSVPGVIFGVGIFTGLINTVGVYLFLGANLSWVGITALLVGLFYSLFISYYALSFLKKIFDFEFLDNSNIWVTFKRTLVFAADLSFPLFALSTCISFISPIYLREFGIILTLCILVFFIQLTLICNALSIKYVYNNFSKFKKNYGYKFGSSSALSDLFFDKFFWRNVGNKTTLVGSGVVVLFLCISIIVLQTAGFNSFSLFKNNKLLTILLNDASLLTPTTDTISNIKTTVEGQIPSGAINLSSGSVLSYLFSGEQESTLSSIVESLKDKLKDNSYSLQNTVSFSDVMSFSDLTKSILFSSIFIFIYCLIRFKFKSLFIFFTNTFLSLLLFVSFITITRLPVSSGLFVSICVFISLSIMYHVFLFSLDKNKNTMSWFSDLSDDMTVLFYRSILFVVAYMGILFPFLAIVDVELLLNYISVLFAMIINHFLVTFCYYLFKDKISYFKNRYLWNSDSNIQNSDEINNLDEYDEELIVGINS